MKQMLIFPFDIRLLVLVNEGLIKGCLLYKIIQQSTFLDSQRMKEIKICFVMMNGREVRKQSRF